MNRIIAALLFALALCAGDPNLAWGRGHGQHEPETQATTPSAVTRAGMSLDEAVQMVQQRFDARVVRAETHSEGERTVYHLKLMNSEGKVWTVRVDAQSGRVQ